ncbi:amino acid permease [Variovorax dokdonensis]|uniref:Amino acid permease n=1 Tax=Variovorax dokdonensis TaxID=344883 RepID=A0ABT7NBR2_9BURK|nr:amino acid permease [Variovorax dokdonensis]MDM0045363.1 amino acid permease [Variovorax dokdonensis]
MSTPTCQTELKKGLKQRHLTMIALGGVIGAGLFVGSAAVILNTGPASFLTYAVTGVLIVLVMRMLGEMATTRPTTGSFAAYASDALGNWAGFSVAWLYWYFWVVVVGFEAVAGAKILTYWLGDVPLWPLAFGLMVLMVGSNLFSVGSFGEFEFWFAGIKVMAIVVFIVLGGLYVFGLWRGHAMDFSGFLGNGGFLPKGGMAIFSSIVVVVFSMVGAEIATIAAAESDDPVKAITHATRSVVMRLGVFYVLAILLLTLILPWNSFVLGDSPFVSAFKVMGIPGADHIMNAVVLTAVLSCLNSGIYTASRMLFVLAERRQAPASFTALSAKGVPVTAILVSSVGGFACVVAAYISPETVFMFLLNSSGAVILFVYLFIAVTQLVLRLREPQKTRLVKMWLFPWLTMATIAALVTLLVQMGTNPETASQLYLSLLAFAVSVIMYFVTRVIQGRTQPATS